MHSESNPAPALVCEDVSFTYPGREGSPALGGISLSIRQGEFVAVAGLNGSGKSTLCRLFNALILPQRGRVLACGLDTASPANLAQIRRSVGLIMQNPDNQIVGPTVEDDVAFGLENLAVPRDRIRSRVEYALEVMGLRGLRGREPHLLSAGEKKRLAVAGVLAVQPRVIVSDESTSMLDLPSRAETLGLFMRLRLEMGVCVVHATHRPEEMLAADRVLLLGEGGLLFAGSPGGLFRERELAAGCGIRPPDMYLLASELERRGYPLSGTPLEPQEVVERLCPSP